MITMHEIQNALFKFSTNESCLSKKNEEKKRKKEIEYNYNRHMKTNKNYAYDNNNHYSYYYNDDNSNKNKNNEKEGLWTRIIMVDSIAPAWGLGWGLFRIQNNIFSRQ